jgi:hypothetical protein
MEASDLKSELTDPHDVPTICRNCGATVSGNYCHHCGQETRLHAPSFAEFVHEFIGHYVALEGRLWGTFTRLLFRPGLLTNEYIAGRRKRYVEPLRLYLSLSILFFALLKFTGAEPIRLDEPAAPHAVTKAASEAQGIRQQIMEDGVTEDESGKSVQLDERLRQQMPRLAGQIDHFSQLPSEKKGKLLSDSFFHYGPYAMFALMPLFALYMKLLYIGSGRRYGEHLLFALHSSAFAFVMFAAITFSPNKFLTLLLLCWLVVYLPWAMRRVYGGSKLATALRWSVLMLAHGISMFLAILAAGGAGVIAGH